MPLDPKKLPRDVEMLQKIVADLAEQLDRESAEKNKYRELIRELLEAQHTRKSERLSKEQQELFERAWRARNPDAESDAAGDDDFDEPSAGAGQEEEIARKGKRGRRQPLARHLKRDASCTTCRSRKSVVPAAGRISG